MNRLLRIDASSRTEGSFSRELADSFEQAWRRRHPNGEVIRRDLIAEPIGHITSETIAAFYTPPDELSTRLRDAVALSDRLIAELRSADTLLIGTPIYNFSIPSALKAYIDQIVRIGQTFAYDGKTFEGLVNGKRAYVICAYGAAGYHDEKLLAAYDFLEPYLRGLLGFLGITDTRFFAIEGTTAEGALVRRDAARTRIVQELAA